MATDIVFQRKKTELSSERSRKGKKRSLWGPIVLMG
jgi:hypothetical protein